MLGTGVMALTLASCHDDPEYTKAPDVVTPPAYFNLSDETVVDLEDTSSDFVVNLYRANTEGELTVPVTTAITYPDGATEGIFTVPSTVTFADGVSLAEFKIGFDIADIKPMAEYYFDVKVDGESTPYFSTEVNYEVSYVPWVTLTNPKTGSDVSTLDLNGIYNADWSLDFVAQEHPGKPGFFRLRHPFYNAPENHDDAGNVISEQRYPETDPNYLYVNATNPRSVFISNSKGKPQVFYYTGWVLDKAEPNYTMEVMLFCEFSAYLAKSFTFPGLDGVFIPGEDYGSKAGSEENHMIDFKDYMSWTYPAAADASKGSFGYGGFNKFSIKMADATVPVEWESIGACDYVDGFIANYFGSDAPIGYKVEVERNIKNPDLIRLVNPYTPANYPEPGDAVGETNYNIEIDLKDPEMVLIKDQSSGYIVSRENYRLCNMAAWLYYGYSGTSASVADIKKDGYTDTYKDGVVTINYPVLITKAKDGYEANWLWEGKPFNAGKLYLPEATEAAKSLVLKKENKPVMHSQRIPVRASLSTIRPLTHIKTQR